LAPAIRAARFDLDFAAQTAKRLFLPHIAHSSVAVAERASMHIRFIRGMTPRPPAPNYPRTGAIEHMHRTARQTASGSSSAKPFSGYDQFRKNWASRSDQTGLPNVATKSNGPRTFQALRHIPADGPMGIDFTRAHAGADLGR